MQAFEGPPDSSGPAAPGALDVLTGRDPLHDSLAGMQYNSIDVEGAFWSISVHVQASGAYPLHKPRCTSCIDHRWLMLLTCRLCGKPCLQCVQRRRRGRRTISPAGPIEWWRQQQQPCSEQQSAGPALAHWRQSAGSRWQQRQQWKQPSAARKQPTGIQAAVPRRKQWRYWKQRQQRQRQLAIATLTVAATIVIQRQQCLNAQVASSQVARGVRLNPTATYATITAAICVSSICVRSDNLMTRPAHCRNVTCTSERSPPHQSCSARTSTW